MMENVDELEKRLGEQYSDGTYFYSAGREEVLELITTIRTLQAENKSLKQTQDKVWNKAVEACQATIIEMRTENDKIDNRAVDDVQKFEAPKRPIATEPADKNETSLHATNFYSELQKLNVLMEDDPTVSPLLRHLFSDTYHQATREREVIAAARAVKGGE